MPVRNRLINYLLAFLTHTHTLSPYLSLALILQNLVTSTWTQTHAHIYPGRGQERCAQCSALVASCAEGDSALPPQLANLSTLARAGPPVWTFQAAPLQLGTIKKEGGKTILYRKERKIEREIHSEDSELKERMLKVKVIYIYIYANTLWREPHLRKKRVCPPQPGLPAERPPPSTDLSRST